MHGAGIEFVPIAAGKYRRFHGIKLRHKFLDLSSIAHNFIDLFRVARGIWQSIGIIRNFKPEAIFIKGGYVGLPVGIAAKLLRYPFVVHESDIHPGLTNRILGRWAEKIAVGFPADKYGEWYPEKLVHTGSPVRKMITGSHRLEGISHFGLDPKVPVVLVIGGSTGARRLNDGVLASLPRLLELCQVIHVAGERDFENVKFATRRLEKKLAERYKLRAFLHDDMGKALEAADVVISRAGANAIAELAILRKPTILVPNPHLTGGHQSQNAQMLSRSGAVRVITEEKLTPHVIAREVEMLVTQPKEREYLSEKIGELAIPDAANRLAKVIMESAREDESQNAGD